MKAPPAHAGPTPASKPAGTPTARPLGADVADGNYDAHVLHKDVRARGFLITRPRRSLGRSQDLPLPRPAIRASGNAVMRKALFRDDFQHVEFRTESIDGMEFRGAAERGAALLLARMFLQFAGLLGCML